MTKSGKAKREIFKKNSFKLSLFKIMYGKDFY